MFSFHICDALVLRFMTLSELQKYGLLTKCEVKMAGYWPSSFFVFMDRDGDRSINSQKENEANIKPS